MSRCQVAGNLAEMFGNVYRCLFNLRPARGEATDTLVYTGLSGQDRTTLWLHMTLDRGLRTRSGRCT